MQSIMLAETAVYWMNVTQWCNSLTSSLYFLISESLTHMKKPSPAGHIWLLEKQTYVLSTLHIRGYYPYSSGSVCQLHALQSDVATRICATAVLCFLLQRWICLSESYEANMTNLTSLLGVSILFQAHARISKSVSGGIKRMKTFQFLRNPTKRPKPAKLRLFPLCHSCLRTINNTSISSLTFTPGDEFLHYQTHVSCSLLWREPSFIILLPWILEHQMCVNPRVKIVPNTCSMYFCFSNIW